MHRNVLLLLMVVLVLLVVAMMRESEVHKLKSTVRRRIGRHSDLAADTPKHCLKTCAERITRGMVKLCKFQLSPTLKEKLKLEMVVVVDANDAQGKRKHLTQIDINERETFFSSKRQYCLNVVDARAETNQRPHTR